MSPARNSIGIFALFRGKKSNEMDEKIYQTCCPVYTTIHASKLYLYARITNFISYLSTTDFSYFTYAL